MLELLEEEWLGGWEEPADAVIIIWPWRVSEQAGWLASQPVSDSDITRPKGSAKQLLRYPTLPNPTQAAATNSSTLFAIRSADSPSKILCRAWMALSIALLI